MGERVGNVWEGSREMGRSSTTLEKDHGGKVAMAARNAAARADADRLQREAEARLREAIGPLPSLPGGESGDAVLDAMRRAYHCRVHPDDPPATAGFRKAMAEDLFKFTLALQKAERDNKLERKRQGEAGAGRAWDGGEERVLAAIKALREGGK